MVKERIHRQERREKGELSTKKYKQELDEIGNQHECHSKADGTLSAHGTALKHWEEFWATISGSWVEGGKIFWGEEGSRRERRVIRIWFMRFMAYLSVKCKSGEGRKGEALGNTIATYARSIVTLHGMVEVELKFLYPMIKEQQHGRTMQLVSLRGRRPKNKKAGFTLAQMLEWERLSWKIHAGKKNPSRRILVLRAIYQASFSCQWRRSESTVKKGKWRWQKHLSRADIKYFDEGGNEVLATKARLRKLLSTAKGYVQIQSPPCKNDQSGEGVTSRFMSLLPLDGEGIFQPGRAVLNMEIEDPCETGSRARTPCFVDPESGEAFKTFQFDQFVIWAVKEASRLFHHKVLSEKEARSMYSLHSFRVGGTNALRTVGAPQHVRCFAGRWISTAVQEYDRQEIREMLTYMKKAQRQDCKLLQVARNEPMSEEASRMEEPGEYWVKAGKQHISSLVWNQERGTESREASEVKSGCPQSSFQAELVGREVHILRASVKSKTTQGAPVQRWFKGTIAEVRETKRRPVVIRFTKKSGQENLKLSWGAFGALQLKYKASTNTAVI